MTAQISLAGAPYPAMIVYQSYEHNGVLTDLDCYLYLDMYGTPGQYIDHLGTVEVKDGKFYGSFGICCGVRSI